MSKKVTDSAKGFGAEMLITACPLCLYNLKKNGNQTLPVYYFTELLAEALGVKEEARGRWQEMNDNKKQAEKIKEISGANPLKCMKCGKCSASCPAFDEMDIKPHQFVSYVINENIDALVQSSRYGNVFPVLPV